MPFRSTMPRRLLSLLLPFDWRGTCVDSSAMKTGTRAVVAVLGAMGLSAAAAACSFDLHELAPPEEPGAGGAASSAATTQSSTTGSGMTTTSASGVAAGGAGGAGTGGAGAAGGGGTGGTPTEGCSDGTREAYEDAVMQPNIAGCAGGWDVPGVTSLESMTAHCNHSSGNDSMNKSGAGCSVEDLCSPSWRVCDSHADITLKAVGGQCPPDTGAIAFWATRQSMNPQVNNDQVSCVASGNNNVYGCIDSGDPTLGDFDQNDMCTPLEKAMGGNNCKLTWVCPPGNEEALYITKTGSDFGGVLCCRD